MKEQHTPSKREPRPTPSRRELLRGAIQAAGAMALAASLPTRAAASTRAHQSWSLIAEARPKSFADGSTVQLTRYRTVSGGAQRGALPFFEAVEGSSVGLSIANNSAIPLNPHIPGVGTAPTIGQGRVGGLRFTMPPAGTHLLLSAPADPLSDALGLGAMIVSHPSSGLPEVWAGGPSYDREYVLLYQDVDSRWNDDVEQRIRPDWSDYEPNFFTVNGLSYPDTTADPDTTIACNVGENVLIRFGNIGRMRHAIHFHGYHVEIVDRDNQPELHLPRKDTFGLPHSGTVNVMLTPHQPGIYPLHPHSLTSVTANGLYPYGQLVLINAT